MSDRRAKGCLFAAVLWCVILALLALSYRFLVHPYFRDKLKGDTGSQSQYEEDLVLAADSFSGYAILRSDLLRRELKGRKIKLTVRDDQADYAARLRSLQKGQVQLAAFTIDSLITAGAELGDFPGTIVMILDETVGSDALLAKRSAVSNLQALNDASARLVLTPRSPSEFLARVVIAHFNLPNLPEHWIEEADGARAVYEKLRQTGADSKRAYVLWEPYVTMALRQPDVHVLLDSSRLRGYIVDVLVAQREFLRDHPEKVRTFIEAYLRAAYAHSGTTNGMIELVREDAGRTGAESLDTTQAQNIVRGIRWKNTLENYAHFGLVSPDADGGLAHLEDMIGNVVDVLVRTGALASDPVAGQYHTLFYRPILAEMKQGDFHPAKGLSVIPDLGPDLAELETVRGPNTIRTLTGAQWANLQAVGELKVAPIVFVRGSSRLSAASDRELKTLAKRLQSFPNFYLRVIGHTRSEGDSEANRRLAESRANAAADYLRQQGIEPDRIKTAAAPESAQGGQAQSVSFEVGQVPY